MEKPRTRWRCFVIGELVMGLVNTAIWTTASAWWTRAVAAIKHDANYAKYYVHICQDPTAICDKIETCHWAQLQLTLVRSVMSKFLLDSRVKCFVSSLLTLKQNCTFTARGAAFKRRN